MKALVIANPKAGSLRLEKRHNPLKELERRLQDHGIEATIHTLENGEVAHEIRRGIRRGADVIVAAGGDGTVNTVASCLVEGPIPCGIIPVGTFNHFARDLGIPLDLNKAAATLATGVVRQVDVGDVNGLIFVNNSSIGAYPLAVKEREEQRRRLGRRKSIAMLLAILRVIRMRPLLKVHLTLDGQRYDRLTPFVFIGNNAYTGNLLSENKRACLDAGELCVFTARCTGLPCSLRLLLATLFGRLNKLADFDAHCGRELRIETSKSSLHVARDGEVCRLNTPLTYHVRPRALRVIVPAATRA